MERGSKFKVFKVKGELRQGDPISTTLFNLVLETRVRRSNIKLKKQCLRTDTNVQHFSDDLTILAKQKRTGKNCKSNSEEENKFGLRINKKKPSTYGCYTTWH